MAVLSKKVLRYSFLITNGSFWFLSVGCAMFLASEVWRFYSTVYLANTGINRRTATGVLVSAILLTYVIGFIGCCAGMRINKVSFIVYLFVAAIGILLEAALLIVLFLSSKMSLQLTNIDSVQWNDAASDVRGSIRRELQCCGFDSPADANLTRTDLSCYSFVSTSGLTEFKVHTTGCRSRINSLLESHWDVMQYAGVAAIIVQVFGIVIAAYILPKIKPAPVTTIEQRRERKPKLKYNSMKKTSGDAAQATARSANVSGLRRRNISAVRSRGASDTEHETPVRELGDTAELVTSNGRSGSETTPVEEIRNSSSSLLDQDDVRAPLVTDEDADAVATPSDALVTNDDTVATNDTAALENTDA